MKIAILAKNPYYYPGEKITPYLAGHSTGFVGPFVDFLIRNGHQVCLISPKEFKKDEHIEEGFFYEPPKSNNFHKIFIDLLAPEVSPFLEEWILHRLRSSCDLWWYHIAYISEIKTVIQLFRPPSRI